MDNKSLYLVGLILVSLVQLYVPAKMIWDNERVLYMGNEFKFRTAPIDPNDPFRGKYITLSFRDNSIYVKNERDWERGEEIYVNFTTDQEGYAQIRSANKERPQVDQDFLKVKVSYVTRDSTNKLSIAYPFNRLYMEESKAYDAEQLYSQFQRDTSKVTYALVSILDGEAVLKDVLMDGVSIRELVKANKERDSTSE